MTNLTHKEIPTQAKELERMLEESRSGIVSIPQPGQEPFANKIVDALSQPESGSILPGDDNNESAGVNDNPAPEDNKVNPPPPTDPQQP